MKKTKKTETKSTKKTVRAPRKVEEMNVTPSESTPANAEVTRKNNFFPIMAGVFLVGLAGGFALTTLYQKQQPAATVNGENITMAALNDELMKQGGQKILDNKVTETLILQEARKQKINISDSDVTKKINDLEKQLTAQGQNMDNLLSAQGQTRDDLKQQVRIQLIVEKLFGKDLTVTEKEAQAYFETNKASYGADVTYESKANEIKDGLKNQKLATKFQKWLEDTKSKAKIQYYLKKA